jgi:diguanylate cyclase (GGDEF)-like protein
MSIIRKVQGLGFVAGLITGSTSATAAVMHLFLAVPMAPDAISAVPLTPGIYWVAAIVTLLFYNARLWRTGHKAQSSARNADAMANLDALTSMPNRRAMLAHIVQMQAGGRGALCGVLIIDLDRFKVINDDFGHAAGDTVLKVVSARITRICGQHAHPYRIGGDEFAVLIDNLRDLDSLAQLTRDLSAGIAKPIAAEGWRVVVDCSIGQAVGTAKLGIDKLIRIADQNMYLHKQMHHESTETVWTPIPVVQLARVGSLAD